jgi:hypothetical protein
MAVAVAAEAAVVAVPIVVAVAAGATRACSQALISPCRIRQGDFYPTQADSILI